MSTFKTIFTDDFGSVTMSKNACDEQLERLALEILELEDEIAKAKDQHDWATVVALGQKKIALNKDVIFFSDGNIAYFNEEILASVKEFGCFDFA